MMLVHTWIEQYRTSQPEIYAALMNASSSAVHFDCGDAEEIPFGKGSDFAEARAPFPSTLLQFEYPDKAEFSHRVILWLDQDDGSAVITGAERRRSDKRWRTLSPCAITRNVDGTFHYEKMGFSEDGGLPAAMMFHALAMNLFFVLGCSNVRTIDNPAPTALNRKRVKAGKMPLLTYKTLVVVVDEARVVNPPMGGSHSSPRVHLRRGHVRRISSTRRVWVQACVVGSKHGMILKDYKVTTKAASATDRTTITPTDSAAAP